jgi:hypothetical protein
MTHTQSRLEQEEAANEHNRRANHFQANSNSSGVARPAEATRPILACSQPPDNRQIYLQGIVRVHWQHKKQLLCRSKSTEIIKMKQNRSFAVLIFVVIVGVGAALAYARYRVGANSEAAAIGVGAFVLALVVACAIQVADQWDKAVILRLGHFHALMSTIPLPFICGQ